MGFTANQTYAVVGALLVAASALAFGLLALPKDPTEVTAVERIAARNALWRLVDGSRRATLLVDARAGTLHLELERESGATISVRGPYGARDDASVLVLDEATGAVWTLRHEGDSRVAVVGHDGSVAAFIEPIASS